MLLCPNLFRVCFVVFNLLGGMILELMINGTRFVLIQCKTFLYYKWKFLFTQ